MEIKKERWAKLWTCSLRDEETLKLDFEELFNEAKEQDHPPYISR